MGGNVLITGASSGIGATVAQYLSKQGYYVILVARNENKLNKIASELEGDSLVVPYDLNNLSDIEEIFKACKEKELKLDGMIHCAGINNDIPISSNDIQVMQNVTTVNYYSFVELGKYFSKRKYSKDNASIVAISSSAAEACVKGMCTYSASKAAVNAAVKVMGKEFLRRKQRVNAIMPSFVDTPMAENVDSQMGNLQEKIDAQPLGLIPTIQIAYLVEFLVSEKSQYITGACIPVSGGAIL